MKRFLAFAGFVVSFACAFYFVRAIAHHWEAISSLSWDSLVWMSMGVALIIYTGTYSLTSYAWNCSLNILGYPTPYRIALRILVLSQFAKYLPGNVGHHVGRVMLAKRVGLPTNIVLGSMILDTFIVLAAAGICSLWVVQLLIQIIRSQGTVSTHAIALIALTGFFAIFTTALLPITRRALSRQIRHVQHLVQMKNLPLLAKALTAHTGSVLAGGTALYLLCIAFTHNMVPAPWLDVTGVYATAWLLGFLIPGAPAGLGVREIALLLGLGPIFGNDAATAAAAALRMVTTLGDGLVFASGFALRRLDAKPPSHDEAI